MIFVYMHGGARMVLWNGVGVRQSGEQTHFVDQAGDLLADVETVDIWLYADHDLAEDVDEPGDDSQ